MTKPGLGILSWKGNESLAAALETYAAQDLFSLFDEKLIFFPEIDEEARALAKRFDLPFEGSAANLGICGGFKALGGAMSSDIVMLLENDCPLIEDSAEAKRQVAVAEQALRADDVVMFRMRSIKHPGQKFPLLNKYKRYHEDGFMPTVRRLVRPGKATRLAGGSLYADPNPVQKFPDLIERTPEGYFKVSAACLPWTNQSIMVKREFLLDKIIAYAEANPSKHFLMNGFPLIEVEWNGPIWRNSGWFIGADKGLFTHERI